MKYIKNFEGFEKTIIDYLVTNKKTFVYPKIRTKSNHGKIFYLEIKNYDISNFEYNFSHNHFIISPDINFNEIYKKYCVENSLKFKNLKIIISVLPKSLTGEYNLIDVENLLDEDLKGLSLAYKLYLFVLDKVDFLMTNKNNTEEAKNLWYNLLMSDEVYSGTSNNISIIINKNITNERLLEILELIKKFNLEFDDDLKKIINEND